MTYAKKTDDNHKLIRQTFRDLGAAVFDTSSLPKFCDLVVQHRSPFNGVLSTYLIEIKDGSKSPSRRKLTAAQVELHKLFNIHIVETVRDVYELLGVNYVD